ncbi:helix-turn-helix domain-containing protein [Bradyrhizobium sp. 182]
MAQADGNVSAAARLLKISRPKLDYRLRRLGIKP